MSQLNEQPSKLSRQSTAYIALPNDGIYGSHLYPGSGATVTKLLQSALLKHLVQVDTASTHENFESAKLSAQKGNYDYLVFPTILHWEDRATEWSAKADKVQIKIIMFEVAKSKIISSVTIDGKSGLATFGGDHPQDLLPQPFALYINGMFK